MKLGARYKQYKLISLSVLILIICLLGSVIAGVFITNKPKLPQTKAKIIPVYQANTENNIYVESDPISVPITASNKCVSSPSVTPVYCTLASDNKTSVTAPATYRLDGKTYYFLAWDGCNESNFGDRVCHVSVQKGALGQIKAHYSEGQTSVTPRPAAGSIKLNVNNQTPAGESDVFYASTIYITDGSDKITATLNINVQNINISNCVVVQKTVKDGDVNSVSNDLQPVATQAITLWDGTYSIQVTCKDQNSDQVTANVQGAVFNNQPKLCKDFSFTSSDITADSLESLKTGIIGHWGGCVATPWTPAYYVDFTFRADGTYSAITSEIIDSQPMNALYYGTQDDSPKKTFGLTDFNTQTKKGTGDITIVFQVGTTSPGTLKDIQLMGDKLSFSFYDGQYGPLTYRLYKK
jgi:hypothetical protein